MKRISVLIIIFLILCIRLTAQSYYVKLVNKNSGTNKKLYPYNYYFVRLFEDKIINLPITSINKYDSAIGIKLKLRFYENDTFYFSQNIAIPFNSIFSLQDVNPNIKILCSCLASNLACIGLFNYYTQNSYVDLRPIMWGNILLGIPAAAQTIILCSPQKITYLREWKIEEYSFIETRSPNVAPKNIFQRKGVKP